MTKSLVVLSYIGFVVYLVSQYTHSSFHDPTYNKYYISAPFSVSHTYTDTDMHTQHTHTQICTHTHIHTLIY